MGATDAATGTDDDDVGANENGSSQRLSDAEYERELETLRKISADATREVETRQASRNAAYSAEVGAGRIKNPMHATPYTVAGLDSPWAGSTHGAADE